MISATLVFTSLEAVIAAATGFESIPREGSPRSREAKFVVPRPQNGSRTQSPLEARLPRMPRGKSSGNIVKYGQMPFRAVCSLSTVGNSYFFLFT
jgi:hypothetical protein